MAARKSGLLRDTLATNLRRLRAAQWISQEELPARVGLHRTFVGAVERCERNISIDNVERLTSTLSLDDLDLLKS